ncbi:hypothetical protein SNOG_03532 [Parastagonospora nodorum SN15]|uniref:Uncharacterized protein n=1 Tax=Phaeosphaeria nodorum (strain SN15 / ATCC MYA-4574 / FGSC 10173) TaxID=321614 RepID=Q0UXI2_PHANO|nr:hypothetical protein SNOG_03532 [Parastagonospora nodorum SN15]EAT88737.1 hypothetical protein SNOG_03532 [Parastagonospora nodorum SN15]
MAAVPLNDLMTLARAGCAGTEIDALSHDARAAWKQGRNVGEMQ